MVKVTKIILNYAKKLLFLSHKSAMQQYFVVDVGFL